MGQNSFATYPLPQSQLKMDNMPINQDSRMPSTSKSILLTKPANLQEQKVSKTKLTRQPHAARRLNFDKPLKSI